MDGLNISKSFEHLPSAKIQKNGKTLMNLGTCPPHTVLNAFLEQLKKICLDVILHQFAIDLHSYCKHSVKRVEDCMKIELDTDIESQNMLRHVVTSWIGICIVLVRVV